MRDIHRITINMLISIVIVIFLLLLSTIHLTVNFSAIVCKQVYESSQWNRKEHFTLVPL